VKARSLAFIPLGDRAEEHQLLDQFGATPGKLAGDNAAPGMRDQRHAR
jgi:hypothetical protein